MKADFEEYTECKSCQQALMYCDCNCPIVEKEKHVNVKLCHSQLDSNFSFLSSLKK